MSNSRKAPKTHFSDNLFQLIASMTKGEKTIFRKQAKIQGGQNKAYVKLYNMLSRRPQSGDTEFMRKLGMEQKPQSYYNLRNYLQNQILKSMIHYNGYGECKMDKQIISIKILIRKRLYALAAKTLLPLLEDARKEERFVQNLELSRLYLSLMQEKGIAGEKQRIVGLQRETIVALYNWNEYEILFHDFQPYLGSFCTFFGSEILCKMEEVQENPLYRDKKRAISARSKRCFYGLRYMSALIQGNFEEAFEQCQELITLYEAHPFLKGDHLEEYASLLIILERLKLAQNSLFEGKTPFEQPTDQNSVQNLLPLENLEHFGILAKCQCLNLRFAISTGTLEMGKKAAIELEKLIKENGKAIPLNNYLDAHYGLAHFYIAIGEPEKAMRHTLVLDQHLPRFRSDGKPFARMDLIWATRLLNLIIAFELEDERMLECKFRAIYRYLYVRDLLKGYLGKFIHIVNSVIRQPLMERNNFYEAEIRNLEYIREDPLERKLLIYFDGLLWLQGKREGKTIVEINRENSLQG